jgi:hypothetical protein
VIVERCENHGHNEEGRFAFVHFRQNSGRRLGFHIFSKVYVRLKKLIKTGAYDFSFPKLLSKFWKV